MLQGVSRGKKCACQPDWKVCSAHQRFSMSIWNSRCAYKDVGECRLPIFCLVSAGYTKIFKNACVMCAIFCKQNVLLRTFFKLSSLACQYVRLSKCEQYKLQNWCDTLRVCCKQFFCHYTIAATKILLNARFPAWLGCKYQTLATAFYTETEWKQIYTLNLCSHKCHP